MVALLCAMTGYTGTDCDGCVAAQFPHAFTLASPFHSEIEYHVPMPNHVATKKGHSLNWQTTTPWGGVGRVDPV
eukprot:363948-Chlamydomonas_euryale.AAC.8